MKYVGTIEVDEVLAYYPLLSELSFVKKNYPDEFELKLWEWPLPKGNLTPSLLISTGMIILSTLESLSYYLQYISDKSARVAAVNYCLYDCVEGFLYDSDLFSPIMLSAFEPRVVHKLKKFLSRRAISLNAVIAGGLLHFMPAELDGTLVEDLSKALAVVANTVMFAQFCAIFIRYPTTLRDQDSMQVIFERNVQAFQAIPFTAEQRTALSVINKIKFGAVQDIRNMSEAERKELFHMLHVGECALVFHIWAREDAQKDGAWERFADDRSNVSTLSRLVFDLEGFFQNHFSGELFREYSFTCLLDQFKRYPSSGKKLLVHELLRAKVQKHSEKTPALFRIRYLFKPLITFFTDQGDKEGLMALHGFVSEAIINSMIARDQAWVVEYKDIIWDCQLLHRCVEGVDPLGLLAKRFRAAEILRKLEFPRLRANDVGGVLRTLGIERKQMDAALFSLSHGAAPGDKLAEVLREFHKSDLSLYLSGYSIRLPTYNALWFYLWEQHREAFVKHMDPRIQQRYLRKE